MPDWKGSDRLSRLPANWESIRRDVLKRDKWRCTWYTHGERCTSTENLEVDHRKPGDDHSKKNLRTLCAYHHGIKSGQEGGEAAARKRAEIHRRFRRDERHPGSLD